MAEVLPIPSYYLNQLIGWGKMLNYAAPVAECLPPVALEVLLIWNIFLLSFSVEGLDQGLQKASVIKDQQSDCLLHILSTERTLTLTEKQWGGQYCRVWLHVISLFRSPSKGRVFRARYHQWMTTAATQRWTQYCMQHKEVVRSKKQMWAFLYMRICVCVCG